jgi:hypothetical protein
MLNSSRVRKVDSTLVLIWLASSLIITASIFWTVTKSEALAVDIAKDKGGLSRIETIDRKWISWCYKNQIAYSVTGERNGEPTKVTVCVSPWPPFSSVR